MSEKCAACDVAGIFRRVELAPLPDKSDCLQPGLCNDWLRASLSLIVAVAAATHLWKGKTGTRFKKAVVCSRCHDALCQLISQEAHVLSAARQVFKIMHYTGILWIGLVHSTAYWQVQRETAVPVTYPSC